eukprot:453917-Rhodomonas_salina.1
MSVQKRFRKAISALSPHHRLKDRALAEAVRESARLQCCCIERTNTGHGSLGAGAGALSWSSTARKEPQLQRRLQKNLSKMGIFEMATQLSATTPAYLTDPSVQETASPPLDMLPLGSDRNTWPNIVRKLPQSCGPDCVMSFGTEFDVSEPTLNQLCDSVELCRAGNKKNVIFCQTEFSYLGNRERCKLSVPMTICFSWGVALLSHAALLSLAAPMTF